MLGTRPNDQKYYITFQSSAAYLALGQISKHCMSDSSRVDVYSYFSGTPHQCPIFGTGLDKQSSHIWFKLVLNLTGGMAFSAS